MTAGTGSPGVPAAAGQPSDEEIAAVVAVLLVRRRRPGPRRIPPGPPWRAPSYMGSRSWARPRGGWGRPA